MVPQKNYLHKLHAMPERLVEFSGTHLQHLQHLWQLTLKLVRLSSNFNGAFIATSIKRWKLFILIGYLVVWLQGYGGGDLR